MPEAREPTGAVPTGEPVAVVDDLKVWTTTSQEKVGHTTYKDSSGQQFATADTYAERTRVHTKKIWYPVQGSHQLADEDFFRITGDPEAFAATGRMRANARKWNKRGKITMVVSVVGSLVGLALPGSARTVVLSVTGLALGGGWYMAYWGAQRMEPEHHAVDRSVAERAARSYNEQLVSMSVQKSFGAPKKKRAGKHRGAARRAPRTRR